MQHAEIAMLLAHGVPSTVIVEAVVYGKIAGLMNSAHEAVYRAEQGGLPDTGIGERVMRAQSEIHRDRPKKVVRRKWNPSEVPSIETYDEVML